MNLIKRIPTIKGIGVFKDFSWPDTLNEFQRYNIIYGLNGSGKTTLSNILRSLELKRVDEGKFVVQTSAGEATESKLIGNATIPKIKVFNRDFVSQCVFTPTDTCLPIFVFGEDSAKKKMQIENQRTRASQLQLELDEITKSKNRDITELDEIKRLGAVRIKEQLRSSGTDNQFNNYNKAFYAEKLASFRRAGQRPKSLNPEEEKSCRERTGRQFKPSLQKPFGASIDLNALTIHTSAVLARTVISEVIASLKEKPAINSWVELGLKIHTESGEEICNFCKGPITTQRKEELTKHFSKEYVAMIEDITRLKSQIDQGLSDIDVTELPDSARLYEDLQVEYNAEVENVRKQRMAVKLFMSKCSELLQQKQSNPFNELRLESKAPEAITFTKVNELIERHNSRSENFQHAVQEARRTIEEHIISQDYDRVNRLESEIEHKTSRITELQTRVDEANNLAVRLDLEIKEHRRPAERINTDLASYLGRKDIALTVEDNGYRITRNGVTATKLSEGEKTALAIIYFLNSLDDRDFKTSEAVVVIDDPVSSLDSNAMFYAHSYIISRTRDAGQLFICTHNFSLLRLVRKSFQRLGKNGGEGLYSISCLQLADGRHAKLSPLDPLLYRFESEYAYLFSKLYSGKSDQSTSIESFYHYPNMARRVLEAFLSFRLPGSSRLKEDGKPESMHSALIKLKFDHAKTMRILNFLNAHSHNLHHDGQTDHNESILHETPAVLSDLLDLIRHSDQAHYEEMVELISSTPATPHTSATPRP